MTAPQSSIAPSPSLPTSLVLTFLPCHAGRMDVLPYLLLAAVVVVVIWVALRNRRPDLPYIKRPSLLTPAELRFYRALLQAVPAGLVVFLKVRLMDGVNVPAKAWREHGAPASGKHLDFVLADAETLDVRMVIEL